LEKVKRPNLAAADDEDDEVYDIFTFSVFDNGH
jgi:hypothetical protein